MTNRRLLTWFLGVLLALGGLAGGRAEEGVSAKEERLDPRGVALLRRLVRQTPAMLAFRMELGEVVEQEGEDGETETFRGTSEIVVRRPDRLRIETKGDLTNRILWKDGESVTLYDKKKNVWARVKDPGSIDDMLRLLVDRYGITLPLADLLSREIGEQLLENLESARLIGRETLGGLETTHVAFRNPSAEWELWVTLRERPYLRKMTIRYPHLPRNPRYTVFLKKFEALDSVPDRLFQPHVPEGAERIYFAEEPGESSPGESALREEEVQDDVE